MISLMNAPHFSLNSQQMDALRMFIPWLRDRPANKPVFRLFGYAGTGKTSLARVIAENLSMPIVFCAFTGKAALRMEQAGCPGAATLHSLLYHVVEDGEGHRRWVRRKNGPLAEAGLVVLDEASMIDEELARDLMSFGKPILALGDPAQLPPVRPDRGDGFFMRQAPDVLLTEIERTAADNPLLELATAAREGRPIRVGTYGDSEVLGSAQIEGLDLLAYDQVITGKNVSRQVLNDEIRHRLGRTGPLPEVGDRLIGTRNDKGAFVRNGEQFVVTALGGTDDDGALVLEVQSLDLSQAPVRRVRVPPQCFTGERIDSRGWDEVQFMDYGYAITAHKSQGSEWNRVLVFDESSFFGGIERRWLYTAITRARTRVTMITAG